MYVLDDDPRVRRALGRLLRAAGHQVELFASVDEFLGSVAHDQPGCLVSDLRLPEVNGLDLFGMRGEELAHEPGQVGFVLAHRFSSGTHARFSGPV